jgi:hypothetical protein
MKLQKIILCATIALTAFGASLGLLEIGNYLREDFAPVKIEIKPIASPVVYPPQNIPDFELSADETPAEASEPEYDGSGDYYIIDGNPKGFEDFENLSITTREWNNKNAKSVAVKPYGALQMKKEFKFSWLNLTDKRISFVTRDRKGISYQFDGKFIDDEEVKLKDSSGEEYSVDAVLKGRLTKWRNGVKIAEAKVKFAMSHGC